MRIIFMGSPNFGLEALKALNKYYEIVAVYSKHPKPAGRGKAITYPPTYQYAIEHNIPVETPKTLKNDEVLEKLSLYKPDLIVVAAYGLILPKSVLEIPKYGCINIHGSILPKWRGAAPIHRAIMAGDQETGITTMQMDEGLDTGDILLIEKIPIQNNDNFQILYDKLKKIGAKLIVKTIENINNLSPIKQDDSEATYADKVEKNEYWFDPEKTVEENFNKIRALTGIKFKYKDNEFFIIHEANKTNFNANNNVPLLISENKMYIHCKNGWLEIYKIQKPGKNIIDTTSFLRGFRDNLSIS